MNKKKLAALKRMLKHRYKITYEEYLDLYARQKGCCAICKKAAPLGTKKGLLIDHDHDTKVVRGLLCSNCNLGIGKLKDSIELLNEAIAYLQK